MVFDYKIKKIYDSSSNIYFKTKELNELGMNSKDIKKMVTEGYIKRLYRGFYELEFQKTYSLSNKYDRQKNYELSIKCLLKCYLLDPTNQKILYKLYNKYIFEGDLLSACYYLSELIFVKKDISTHDILVLYLFQYLMPLPYSLRVFMNNINKEEIINSIGDEEFKNIAKNVLYDNFKGTRNSIESNYSVIKNLAYKVGKQIYDNQRIVIDYINDSKYEEILKYYKNKKLTKKEKYIVMLVDIFINLNNTNDIPQVKALESYNLFDAIDKNRFDDALKYSIQYNKENVFYLLLKKITQKIDYIILNKEKKTLSNKDIVRQALKILQMKLINNEIDEEFYESLDRFLLFLKKDKYKFIVMDLLKIDLLRKDNTYALTNEFLYNTMFSYLKINVSYYKKCFYNYLNENDVEISKIYLDIIEKVNDVLGIKEDTSKYHLLISNISNNINIKQLKK